MKIEVLCRRQLNSKGSGGSRNRWFSRHFWGGVKSAILGMTFTVFCDFWVPMGSQKGSIFDKNCIFFGVWISDDFRSNSHSILGGVGGSGWASGEGDFLIRRRYKLG